jgi:hypothetical protein
MPYHSDEFDLPPEANKDDGSPRMVGFELEFSGISLDETAEAMKSALGASYSRNLLPNGLFIQTHSGNSSSNSIGPTSSARRVGLTVGKRAASGLSI